MCLIHRDFNHFHAVIARQFSSPAQRLVNDISQAVINHADE